MEPLTSGDDRSEMQAILVQLLEWQQALTSLLEDVLAELATEDGTGDPKRRTSSRSRLTALPHQPMGRSWRTKRP